MYVIMVAFLVLMNGTWRYSNTRPFGLERSTLTTYKEEQHLQEGKLIGRHYSTSGMSVGFGVIVKIMF